MFVPPSILYLTSHKSGTISSEHKKSFFLNLGFFFAFPSSTSDAVLQARIQTGPWKCDSTDEACYPKWNGLDLTLNQLLQV